MTLIYFSIPELIIISLAIITCFVATVIILNKDHKEKLKTVRDMEAKNAIDAYMIYCRNEAIKRYTKKKNDIKRDRELHPNWHIDYRFDMPEDSIDILNGFNEIMKKINNRYLFLMNYYNYLPGVMYSFVESEDAYHSFSGDTEMEDRILYLGTLERFHLDLDSRRKVEEAIKEDLDLPVF